MNLSNPNPTVPRTLPLLDEDKCLLDRGLGMSEVGCGLGRSYLLLYVSPDFSRSQV